MPHTGFSLVNIFEIGMAAYWLQFPVYVTGSDDVQRFVIAVPPNTQHLPDFMMNIHSSPGVPRQFIGIPQQSVAPPLASPLSMRMIPQQGYPTSPLSSPTKVSTAQPSTTPTTNGDDGCVIVAEQPSQPAAATSSPKCPICLSSPMVRMTSTHCGHVFCYRCIISAIRSSQVCPICRAKTSISSLHRIFL